jgi:septum formation protein
MKKIILASTSPRRKEILSKSRLSFETQAPDYEEDMTLDMAPTNLVEFLSLGKAKAVAEKNDSAIIIAADTFVVYQDHRLGKPKTPERAKEMLEMLSGQAHELITGVTIIDTETGAVRTFHETVKVYMSKLSSEIIDAYIGTGEPLDKAGAYALQETGALLIEKIEGDFFSAMGLPLKRLAEELKGFGVNAL